MADFHGKRGTASFTNITFEILSFEVNMTYDVAETTVMDSSAVATATHWKTYIQGMKGWTATAECLEPAAGALSNVATVLGSEATLTLDSTAGDAYAGTAICTGFSPSIDVNDIGKCTLTFQGIAALAAS
jgi:hypothetical protein